MRGTRLLHVRTLPDPEALARHAAQWLLEVALATDGRFAVCLSGGSTPRRLYELLASAPIRDKFPWSRTHWFFGDERFVPPDHPESNFAMVRAELFSRAPVPPDKIHAIVTEGRSPVEAAADYEARLKDFYGTPRLDPKRPLFDVTFLGIGEDGHVASLFPAAATLEERERWVVPAQRSDGAQRISLTLPPLASSRAVAFLVTGSRKQAILSRLRAGDQSLPAARVHPVGDVFWFVDAAAAGTRPDPDIPPAAGLADAKGTPAAIIVMGVSGSGKTTVGTQLAMRLRWEFQDADWFHPPENIEKMHAGVPLTDQDRAPWLRAIATWIDETRRAGRRGVVTCSALKRRYRDILMGGRPDVRLVYLKGDEPLIARRIAARDEHFMPASLLRSQYEALEEPGEDERPIVVSIAPRPPDIVAEILARLKLARSASVSG